MCGRYASTASTAALIEDFDIDEVLDDDLAPSWNVAPTDPVRLVTRRHDTTQLRTVRWGLVPSWSKTGTGGARLINVRGESLVEKFSAAAGRRRALTPAAGYYEWQKTTDGKTPHFIHAAEGGPLAFASVYEIWRRPDLSPDDPDAWLWTSSIITRPAVTDVVAIHDRSPVVVPPDMFADWLDCSSESAADAIALLRAMPEPRFAEHVVSSAVGNVRNNSPSLMEPAPRP